ncbi:hypothetical protein FZ983_17700 [Azospirillum sp. B21]|uniref:hypothetical protein n=1 Tax=Azospirillum sp. B21 TaxID=2607496 RepID=UPI0011EBE760|nr:hypothetical protein [Azospirillum sp. B21]KAA0579148.1 hypothetical protein FZ983_17700 [Azospirillum sp. B21]
MTAPLSLDLRERLMASADGGQSWRSAAKRFVVAPSTAIKWVALWRRDGHVQPKPMGGHAIMPAECVNFFAAAAHDCD